MPDSFGEVHLFIQFQIPQGSHQKVNTEKGQNFFFSFFLDKQVPMNKTDFANTFHLVNLTLTAVRGGDGGEKDGVWEGLGT